MQCCAKNIDFGVPIYCTGAPRHGAVVGRNKPWFRRYGEAHPLGWGTRGLIWSGATSWKRPSCRIQFIPLPRRLRARHEDPQLPGSDIRASFLKVRAPPAMRSCAHSLGHRLRSALQHSSSDVAVPVLLSPFRTGASHVVQLGPVGLEKRVTKPAPPPAAVVSRLHPGAETANNTLATYEFENVLISNLPVVGLTHWFPAVRFSASFIGCR